MLIGHLSLARLHAYLSLAVGFLWGSPSRVGTSVLKTALPRDNQSLSRHCTRFCAERVEYQKTTIAINILPIVRHHTDPSIAVTEFALLFGSLRGPASSSQQHLLFWGQLHSNLQRTVDHHNNLSPMECAIPCSSNTPESQR